MSFTNSSPTLFPSEMATFKKHVMHYWWEDTFLARMTSATMLVPVVRALLIFEIVTDSYNNLANVRISAEEIYIKYNIKQYNII